MTAPVPLVELAKWFVQCYTRPGFEHFKHFLLAHAALWGAPHCVTETLRVADPLSRNTDFLFDGEDRLTRVTDALSGATAYGYDRWGNLARVTDARSNATQYYYDTTVRLNFFKSVVT